MVHCVVGSNRLDLRRNASVGTYSSLRRITMTLSHRDRYRPLRCRRACVGKAARRMIAYCP
jgi:hypothetical protein